MTFAYSAVIFNFFLLGTYALAILVSALILGLLAFKHGRVRSRAYANQCKEWMRPVLGDYLRGPGAEIPERLLAIKSSKQKRVFQYLLIHSSFGASRETIERISQLYERMGFIQTDLRRCRSLFWWDRVEGIRCIGQMRWKPCADYLLAALKDPVLEVRLMSAWSLGRIGEAHTIETILESLANASKLAGMRLSSTVFELGGKAVPHLIRITGTHAEAAVRLLAVHLLGELRDTASVPVLIEKCDPSENKEIRIAAYKALGGIKDDRAVSVLLEGLREPAWELRAQAAKAIGALKAREAVELLCSAMGDKQWWVRRNSAEALAQMGEAGIAALKRVRKGSEDRFARDMASEWLDELGII